MLALVQFIPELIGSFMKSIFFYKTKVVFLTKLNKKVQIQNFKINDLVNTFIFYIRLQ